MQVLRSYRFREEIFEGRTLKQASKDIAGLGHRCGVVVGRVAYVWQPDGEPGRCRFSDCPGLERRHLNGRSLF